MKRKVRPNVVSGGTAINLGNNLYYMRGKTHKQGGIDIGSNPKTGIEVENGEVVQTSPTGLRVFSAQPILNGISPANALLMGGNPNNIFNAQEAWKQANHYNDDGTKFEGGGYTPSKEIIDYIKKTEGFRDKWYKDGNGIDTIGYGFTGSRIKKLYPNGITREQADKEFADSIAKRVLILARDTPNWNKLSQNQKDALLSYHYNVGEGSYRNKHPKLQQALTNLDWDNVALNMDAGYNDKKNPGLRTRRDYERQLFKSGIDASFTGEKQFRDWYDRYSRSHNLNPNPDVKEHFYDYRSYYKNRTKEQANEEWKLDSHLPDTYKMPGHPTFSTESIYSTRRTPGGTWKKIGLGPVYDEQFVDSKYTKRLKKYNNVSFKMGGIGPSKIIGPTNNILLNLIKRKYLTDYANKGRMSGYPYDYKHLIEDYILSPYNYKKGFTGTNRDKELIDFYINGSAQRRALFSKYYNLNNTNFKPDDYIIESKYKPSKSSNENVKYYTYKTDNVKDKYIAFANNNGKFKIDYGEDDNGKYISLYDIWDLAPFGNKTGNQLSGVPIEMYDRIYENDDKQFYNRFKEDQELVKKYGGIHIKPSKRGTFTAAAKRHHMSVQEFARTVLNNRARFSAAMVKKANFARNASKWHKKELGGDMTKQYYITKNNVYSLGGNKVEDKYVLGFNDELGLTGSIPASTVVATRVSPIEHITNYYKLKEFLNRRRKKAPYGTQYRIDENGRLVPVEVPKLQIPIADLSGRNETLEPIKVVDTGRKLPTITGKVENPETIVGNTFPNQNRKRTIPVSIQDITTPISSPKDAELNKPEFYSTVKSSFSNPNYSLGIQDVKNPKTSELPGGTKSSSGKVPKNPYYSKLNIGLKKIGNFLASPDGADLLGLGINLTGNFVSSLINRKAIKDMDYGDAPIPISAQKLPTEVNVEPQASSIRENVAGQERLIGDNTSDSRVALARRQRVRNQGLQQYQSLMGNKQNTETQLLTADRLNRQGVDTQNVTQYNQWRRGLYDFNNRKIEMNAENNVAGVNNAAEAIAGEKGYFARREARQQNLLDMALIAATSPNAQNVIGSKEFEDFLYRIGYDGRFGLLRKRINI